MQQQKKDEIDDFLRQVSDMSVNEFTVVRDVSRDFFSVQFEAEKSVKLGAADFSWLDKHVRDTIRPLLTSLEWPSHRLSSMALPLTLGACQAIIHRDRLSEEQYEAYVGGFRKVGLTLPAWQPPKN